MYLGIASFVCIFIGTERHGEKDIHDKVGVDFEAPSLQFITHLVKQGLAKVVLIDQPTKFQHRGDIKYGKAAQANVAAKGFLARQIDQIKSVLDEANAQHALPSYE